MPTLDTHSLLSDSATIWLDEPAVDAALPDDDPLAQALPWLVRHLGVAAAVEAVVGPVGGPSAQGSDQILPALRRIGFDARMVQRPLHELGAGDLPAVLLLRNGDACVLTARHADALGEPVCTVVMPGPQSLTLEVPDADIVAEYSGVALLVSRPRPPLRLAGRSPFGQAPRAGPASVSALAEAIRSASLAIAQAERTDDPAPLAHRGLPQPVPAEPLAPVRSLPAMAAAASAEPATVARRSAPAAHALPAAPAVTVTPAACAAPDAARPEAASGRVNDDAVVVLDLSFLARPASGHWRRSISQALLGWTAEAHRAARRVAAAAAARARPGAGIDAVPLHPRWLARTWQARPQASRLTEAALLLPVVAICLLIGAPLAWARMVSAGSLRDVTVLVPQLLPLLRQALAADQDRAVLALIAGASAAPDRSAAGATAAASVPAGPSVDGERTDVSTGRTVPRRMPRLH